MKNNNIAMRSKLQRIAVFALVVVIFTFTVITAISAEDGYQYNEEYWSTYHSINDGESLYFTLWRHNNGVQYYYDNLIEMGGSREILQIHDNYTIESSVYDSNGDGYNDKIIEFTPTVSLSVRQYDHRSDYYYNYVVVFITFYGDENNAHTFDDIKGVVNSYKGEDQHTYYAHGVCFDGCAGYEIDYKMTVYLHDKSQNESFRCKYDIEGAVSINGNNDDSVTDYVIYNLDRNRIFEVNERFYINTWEDNSNSNKRVYYNILQRYSEQINSNDSLIPIILSPNQNNMLFESMGVSDFAESGEASNDFFVLYTIDYDSMQYEPQNKRYYDFVYIYVWFHNIDEQGLSISDFTHVKNTDLMSNGLHSLSISKSCQLECTIVYQFFNGDTGFSMFTDFNITIIGDNNGNESGDNNPPIITPPSNNGDYSDGYNDALTIYNFMSAILSAPVVFISEALSFDVFGVNVLNFVRVLITGALVFIVVRWIINRGKE